MPVYDDVVSEEVIATESEIDSIKSVHEGLWESFVSGSTRSYSSRLTNLKNLKRLVNENVGLIEAAIRADLSSNDVTPHLVDCKREIDYMISNLSKLMKNRSVSSQISIVNFPSSAYISPEPLGVVLIVGTWNYPFHSAIGPLAGAIAAGNTVLVKPGSLSRKSSRVISELIKLYFDSSIVACIEGGKEVMEPVLDLKFGHIFFTGGTNIGKIIMTAAAKTLCSVTLELGGKNPVIVTKSCDINLAARRIAWGKWASNAGQVCISPDHVYVDSSVGDLLISRLMEYVDVFFPEGADKDPNYPRIISRGHTRRLESLIAGSRKQIVFGGVSNIEEKYVSPTIVDFGSNSDLMRDSFPCEIFGPILPIVRYDDESSLMGFLSKSMLTNPSLSFYVFDSGCRKSRWIESTSSGAVVFNDCGMHIVEEALSFGGTGTSGIGSYHGEKSFEIFTHMKPVLIKSGWLDIPMRYPPVTDLKKRIVRFLLWLGRRNITPIRIGKVALIMTLVYKIIRH